MYLTALITKWRGKGINWVLTDKGPGSIEITACDMEHKRYVSIVSESLEDGCKFIDQGLTAYMEKRVDNDHINS